MYANSLSPYVGFVPGFMSLALLLALPMTVLAAILERPFVSRVGVKKHALWYSLQANFVSMILGYLTFPIALASAYSAGQLLWPFVGVSISIFSEGWYYRWRGVADGSRFQWRWIVAGNLLSNAVLLMIPFITERVKEYQPDLVWKVEPYETNLLWVVVMGSLAAFILGFVIPALGRKDRKQDPRPLSLVEVEAIANWLGAGEEHK